MKKRIICGILAALMAGAVLSGCGDKQSVEPGEKYEIRMTYAAGEIDSVNQELDVIFADFYKEHPNCEVVLEEGGSTMMAKIAANDAPDIIRVSAISDIPTFANKNIIMPLEDRLEKSELFDKNDIFPQALNAFTYDGKEFGKGHIYGLPKDWCPDFLWVNKEMIEAAGLRVPTLEEPLTYSELSEYAKALTKKDENGVSVFGLNDNTGGKPYRLELLLNLQGKSMWSEDFKTVLLDQEEVRAAFKWLYEMEINGYCPSEINPIDSTGNPEFAKGIVAINSSALWAGGGYSNSEERTVALENLIIAPPAVADGTNKIVTSCSPTGAVIYAKTKNPDLVYDCWEFIHLGKAVEMRARKAMNMPIKKSVADAVSIEDEYVMNNFNTVNKMAQESEAIAIRTNPYVSNSGVGGVITKYYVPLLNGRYTFDEAMDLMQKELQILVDEGVENF